MAAFSYSVRAIRFAPFFRAFKNKRHLLRVLNEHAQQDGTGNDIGFGAWIPKSSVKAFLYKSVTSIFSLY